MSALYDIAQKMYAEMETASKLDEVGQRVYVGKLTHVFELAGGSSAYYSKIRKLLLSPDKDPCIEIRQQGNRHQTSIVVLRHPPPVEWEGIAPADLTTPAIGARIQSIEQRLAELDAWRETVFREVNLLEVLHNFETRLDSLEREGNGKTKATQRKARTTTRTRRE